MIGKAAGTAFTAIALLGAGATSAQADATYEGKFKGYPSSQVVIHFERQAGERVLTSRTTNQFPITCENGQYTGATGGAVDPPVPVLDRRFTFVSGDKDDGEPPYTRLSGHLSHGKAEGVFRLIDNWGGPLALCDTGKLEWVARKQ